MPRFRILKYMLSIIGAVTLVSFSLTLVSCTITDSSGSFEQILSVIPYTEDNRALVVINDYAQIRKEFQISTPVTDATVQEQVAYLKNILTLGGLGTNLVFPASIGFVNSDYSYMQYSLEAMHNLGLGYWSVDQEARAGDSYRQFFTVLKGQFDPQKTRRTLAVSSKEDPPSLETYRANTIFSWGEDSLLKRMDPPAYDVLGRGGRFVFQNDYTFRTNQTPQIKLVLDTQNNKHDSLADVSEFRLMAQELSSYGAFSAILSNQTQSLDYIRSKVIGIYEVETDRLKELMESLEQGPKLLAYQAMALGIARDDNGLYLLIILAHEDGETASKNVALLRRRIEETSSRSGIPWTSKISSASITSHDQVLTAKLYGDISKIWYDWYFRPDPLVLHE